MRQIFLAVAFLVTSTSVTMAQPIKEPVATDKSLIDFETGRGIDLPTGRLQLISFGERSAAYLDLDRVEHKGTKVSYWTYTVYAPAIIIDDDKGVQEVSWQTIDCNYRTILSHGATLFDETGEYVVGIPQDEPSAIAQGSAQYYQAKVLCDGAEMPRKNLFVGRQAAFDAAQATLLGN